MAGRLLVPCNPALDEDGEPMSGAKLFTYAANTTVEKVTYTTAALDEEHENPVQADAAGRFPEIWAADGEIYRLSWKAEDASPSDDAIQVYEDIQVLGEDLGNFTRDYGPDGRARLYGEDGGVHLEAGPPTGDDVGGTLRIGGYDGSQGDVLNLDFDEVEIGGYQMAEVVIESGTVSAASQKDILIPDGFTFVILTITELITSADTVIHLRTKAEGDSDFRTGGTDYSGGSSIPLTGTVLGSVSGGFFGRFDIAVRSTRVIGRAGYLTTGATESSHAASGRCQNNTGLSRAIRIYPASGTFQFSYMLTGQRALPTVP